jgi:hypothetical protein
MYTVYDMYMKVIYTVGQFRKETREALNTVEAGEEIWIIRHGKKFIIKLEEVPAKLSNV